MRVCCCTAFEAKAASATDSPTLTRVSRQIKIDWGAIRQRYEAPATGGGATAEKQSGDASALAAMRARRSTYAGVLAEIEDVVHEDADGDAEAEPEPEAEAAKPDPLVTVEDLDDESSDSGSYTYESDEDDEGDQDEAGGEGDAGEEEDEEPEDIDMSVLPPDEEHGQFDWATLEAELLGDDDDDDGGGDNARAGDRGGGEAEAEASESESDADSEIRRMQEELDAESGGLETTDILATLAALEAPHEQLEADDGEDDDDEAPARARDSRQAVSDAGSSYESDSDADDADADDAEIDRLTDLKRLRDMVMPVV